MFKWHTYAHTPISKLTLISLVTEATVGLLDIAAVTEPVPEAIASLHSDWQILSSAQSGPENCRTGLGRPKYEKGIPFFLKTLFQVKSSLQSLSISLDLERLVLIIWNVWKVAIGSNSRPVTQIAVENWHSTEAIFYNDSSLGNDAARAGEPCYFLSDILVWTGHESRRIISRWGTRSHEDTFWAKPQITSKRSNK